MTTYEYEPLPTTSGCTRFLALLSGEFTEDIRVEILTFVMSVNSAISLMRAPPKESVTSPATALSGAAALDASASYRSPGLEYEALSYTWGSEDDQKTVWVDNAEASKNAIMVTQNLDAALRALRFRDRRRVMWVDAICINQGDPDERSRQVMQMGHIYRNAHHVLVWLGHEAENSSLALRTIHEVGRKIVVVGDYTRNLQPSEAGKSEPQLASLLSPIQFEEPVYEAICCLLSRGWFERLWIRQEVHLATMAYIQCGDLVIPWKSLEMFSAFLELKKPSPSDFLKKNWARYTENIQRMSRLCSCAITKSTYFSLRHELRGVKWKDPRDAIYAVQDMLDHSDHILQPRPDYRKSSTEVYRDVVVRVIQDHCTLHLLTSCELSSRTMQGLPSWVPDWSAPMDAPDLPGESIWSSCAWISAQAKILSNGLLRATGIHISLISKVGWEYAPRDSFDVPYVGGGSLLDAYCRVMWMAPFAEDQIDPVHRGYSREKVKQHVRTIWQTGKPRVPWPEETKGFLTCQRNWFRGRCFFSTTNGHIGLGPVGAKPGDVLCVLLGLQYPSILRKEPFGSNRWQFVGTCRAAGLMYGEAIHGPLAKHLRVVQHSNSGLDKIARWPVALQDKHDGTLKTNPADILREMGIDHSRYQRRPHILEVAPEVLRKSNVKLRDFDSV